MRIVLDSGGVSAVTGDQGRLAQLRVRSDAPMIVPAAVLVESLTGDHRRDFATDRLVRVCTVLPVDEQLARSAARLRTSTKRKVSAVDALVVATADRYGGALVLTSDRGDIEALARHASTSVLVEVV